MSLGLRYEVRLPYIRYLMGACSVGDDEMVCNRAIKCCFVSGESAGYKTNRCEYSRLKKPSISKAFFQRCVIGIITNITKHTFLRTIPEPFHFTQNHQKDLFPPACILFQRLLPFRCLQSILKRLDERCAVLLRSVSDYIIYQFLNLFNDVEV